MDIADFEQFMRAHQNMVFSMAVRLVANQADAADICQETFLRAHEHFETLHQNPAAHGWLRRVATNLALNHLTRYRARWRFFSEWFREDQEGSVEEILPDPTDRGMAEEQDHRRQYLEAALQKLPESQRIPLVLYHFEELSYEEIASKLGISLSKVKTDIHRARLSLRRWLRPDLHVGEETSWMKPDPNHRPKQDRSHLQPWQEWACGFRSAISKSVHGGSYA